MSKSDALDAVLRVGRERERNAARELGRARQELDQGRALLGQLIGHRDEYRANLIRRGVGGVEAARLLQYRHFLTRLDRAIEEQRKRITALEAQVENQRRAWLESRRHLQAVEKLAEKRRTEALLRELRREQAETDDRNGMARRGSSKDTYFVGWLE